MQLSHLEVVQRCEKSVVTYSGESLTVQIEDFIIYSSNAKPDSTKIVSAVSLVKRNVELTVLVRKKPVSVVFADTQRRVEEQPSSLPLLSSFGEEIS